MEEIKARFFISNDSRQRDGSGKVVHESVSIQAKQPGQVPVPVQQLQVHGTLSIVNPSGSIDYPEGEFLVTITPIEQDPAAPAE